MKVGGIEVDEGELRRYVNRVVPAVCPDEAAELVASFVEQFDEREAVIVSFDAWLRQPRAEAYRHDRMRRKA